MIAAIISENLPERIKPLKSELRKIYPHKREDVYYELNYDIEDFGNLEDKDRHLLGMKAWAGRCENFGHYHNAEPRPLRPAEISLWYKHISVWSVPLDIDQKTLVVEDDIVFTHNNSWLEVYNSDEWDVLFLGEAYTPAVTHKIDKMDGLAYEIPQGIPASRTTDAYLLSPRIRSLMAKAALAFGPAMPIDWDMSFFMKEIGAKVWHLTNPCITQGKFPSSVQT